MTLRYVSRVEGEVFTAEFRIHGITRNPQGRLCDAEVYLSISPSISVGDIFEDYFPDMPDFVHVVSTPGCSLFAQVAIDSSMTIREGWAYMKEQVVEFVARLDMLEQGRFIQKMME